MRKVLDHALKFFTGLCAFTACALFAILVFSILKRGLPAINLVFLLGEMKSAGAEGGIFYNMIGTLILIFTALVCCIPFALSLALLHSVFLPRKSTAQRTLSLFLYVLNGMPSILLGLFGLIVFVKYLGWGKSWLTGGLLLGFMILPTIAVALIERIEGIPRKYIDTSRALGMKESQVVWSVILPQSVGGLITGSLLGLARAAGETAPIMFTATIFAGATVPQGIQESPVLSLPYHIFILAQDSFHPAAAQNVWGAALVLLALVFTLSLMALPLRLRIHEEAQHA